MFEELEAYTSNDHFFFDGRKPLSEVCNAPIDGVGVYLVYRLSNGRIDLVYIGSSGKVLQNGTMKVRNGGLYDRIVHGKQFGAARNRSWKNKLDLEKIDALDVYWYHTFVDDLFDIPSFVEGVIIQRYFDLHGLLPEWNKEY